MAARSSLTNPRPPTAAPRGGRPRRRQRIRSSSTAPADRPDPAVAASEAVAAFLRDASAAGVREPADTAGPPGSHAPTASAALARQLAVPPGESPAARFVADSVALQAAAASIVTLNRIETAAAKVEADIRVALRAQAELQAGAAAAAETAVRAAESAWAAADAAAAAQARARIVLMTTIVIVIMIVVISMFIPFELG
jgi:hypothetical protein